MKLGFNTNSLAGKTSKWLLLHIRINVFFHWKLVRNKTWAPQLREHCNFMNF